MKKNITTENSGERIIEEMDLKQNISTEKLENGVSFIGEQIKIFHSLIFGYYVRVGSDYENERLNGISHLTEHLIFKGTKRRKADEISRLIEHYGGTINAYTARDHTSFYFKCLPDNFNRILPIFQEMLFEPLIPEDELEKEKNVVIEEIRSAEDDPEDLVFENLNRIVFKGSPFEKTILGSEDIIKSITRNDVLNFIEKNYISDNSFYSYVGPLTTKNIRESIDKKYFRDGEILQKNDIKIKDNFSQKIYVYKNSLQQFHVALGFKTQNYYSDERFPLTILSAILGIGMSSRLFKKLREEKGLVYTVYSFVDIFKESGMSGIYFVCSPDNYRKTMGIIEKEMSSIIRYGVEKDEMEKVKNQILANVVMSYDSLSGRMGFNAKSFLYKKRIESVNSVIKKFKNVSSDDIKDIAKKYFKFDKLNISIVGNKKNFKI
ncbi:MAG: pitrilysin family protein [candidate division WOR-3 bacterium]